jgi:hypothetical protein
MRVFHISIAEIKRKRKTLAFAASARGASSARVARLEY